MQALWQRLPRWGKWTIGILAVLSLIALVAPSEDDGGDQAATPAVTGTTSAPSGEPEPTPTQTQTVPAQTIAAARHAVDDDDYAAALAIAATLTAGETASVRRRIANRLGTRALAAV